MRKEYIYLWLCLGAVTLQCVFYFITFTGSLSNDSGVWADFATFFGLSFSFISAIFIYLTYRSQTIMSSTLQFESIFFQWHQQHREIYKSLSNEISVFSEIVAYNFIQQHKGKLKIEDFQNHSNDSEHRNIIRYYRSLYQIMKYIHLTPILDNEEQRKKYFDIIQAQMTDEELNTFLFLLFSDKNLNDKRVLKTCSLLELVDSYHLFKNFYYPASEDNFTYIVEFMCSQFPQTKNSFHFLRCK